MLLHVAYCVIMYHNASYCIIFSHAVAGSKTSLSMKDVDQRTGEDLNPVFKHPSSSTDTNLRNPDRPSSVSLLEGTSKEVGGCGVIWGRCG